MSTIKVTNIEHASTANGGIQLDNAGHVTVDGQQMPTSGPLSNRNLVINGAMQVAQRGTSNSDLNSYATVDRFRLKRVLTDNLVGTQQQSTTAPAGFSNSYKVDITTAEGTLSADEFFSMRHLIEAQNLQHLDYNTSDAKAVTLSFWVRSHVTGTYAVGIENPDGSRNIAKTYSVSSADTWEHKIITFPGDTGGANPNNDNGIGFQIDWYLAAGSNFTSSNGSTWAAKNNNRRAHGQSANAIGTTGSFYLTGVQLEVGEKATPFEHRSFGDELARCQRYFCRSYAYGIATGSSGNNGAVSSTAYGSATYASAGTATFPVEMRATPSVTIYGTGGTQGKVNADSGEGTGQAAFINSRHVFLARNNDGTGVAVNVYLKAHYTANAEL
jgi:hypothetical protein